MRLFDWLLNRSPLWLQRGDKKQVRSDIDRRVNVRNMSSGAVGTTYGAYNRRLVVDDDNDDLPLTSAAFMTMNAMSDDSNVESAHATSPAHHNSDYGYHDHAAPVEPVHEQHVEAQHSFEPPSHSSDNSFNHSSDYSSGYSYDSGSSYSSSDSGDSSGGGGE